MNTLFAIRTFLRRSRAAAALVLCLVSTGSPAGAFEAVVLREGDIKPYQEAIAGFKGACGCTVREFGLSDLDAVEKAVQQQPDAIVAVGSRAFRRVKQLRTAPVLYTMVIPSETAVPLPANISGVSMDVAPQVYFDAMRGLFPKAARIGVLSDPAQTGVFVQRAASAAKARGLSLVVRTVSDPREVPAALSELRGKADVLWMLPDATAVTPETTEFLLLFSFQNRIPLFSFSEKYVVQGAVAALVVDPAEMGMQAGEMAQAVVRGEAGTLRAYARNPRLIVNTKVGEKLGVPINGEFARAAKKVE